jgi:hypothetical protein
MVQTHLYPTEVLEAESHGPDMGMRMEVLRRELGTGVRQREEGETRGLQDRGVVVVEEAGAIAWSY